MQTIKEKARDIPVADEVDVLVAGGGPAGIITAIASARNGARTLLVEKNGFLGGVAGLGIPIQGFHDDNNRQIVGGIPLELIERLVKEGASSGFSFIESVERAHGSSIWYDNFKLRTIASEMVCEAGVKLLLHTVAAKPLLENNSVKGVFIESKSGRQAILAKIVVDASGDGDIAARSGAEFEKGNAQGFLQPITVLFRISNVDMKQFLGDLDTHPEKYGIKNPNPNYWEKYQKGVRKGINGLQKLCKEAQAKGDYDMPNPLVAIGCLPREGEVVVNMAHVKLVDVTNVKDLTRAEITGNNYVWKTMNFLKKYVKGFKNSYVTWVAPYARVRETRRIIGEDTLHEDEMVACKKFEDRIAMGGRGVDIHDPTPDNTQSCRSMYMRFPKGYYFPLRSLIPKKIDNLLVAGRCISVSYRAFGSTRVMAQCMATGQAAGTAAALVIKDDSSLRNVDIKKLQNRLRKDKAILD